MLDPTEVLYLGLIGYFTFHLSIYVSVLRTDRNYITQTGLLIVGLVPLIGLYILIDQALLEAGLTTRKRGEPLEPAETDVVGSVSEFRRKSDDSRREYES